ncbi:hypothetical protein Ddye_000208 [Dipteronia dyeriana]|uniref:Disease resistance protein At3g14460 n=1 Tax=Dipteronia dyeriana TaxID=168575 RepID=A0AAD9XLD4_9ROSI|nr:hypothetical protein Ddye_000208 [Dipteronia dyeriana]
MFFADFQGQVFVIKRFIQRLSEDEGVEIVGYKAPTSFCHSGIISQQDAKELCYSMYHHGSLLASLLKVKEEELQLQGLPFVCQYLVLDSVCLTKLPQALHSLDCLRRICISNCSELVSFPEATLPSQLRAIDIESCNALKWLPDTWMDCTSLEYLSISKCGSLKYLARKQLPPNLKEMMIKNCNNLKTLMQEGKYSLPSSTFGTEVCPSTTSPFSKSEFLATLEIEKCHTLENLSSSGYLPKALKYLSLISCSKLESVAERFHDNTCLGEIVIRYCESLQFLPEDMQKLDHAERISIFGCPSLVSFPGGGLPWMNLTELKIVECRLIEALPHNMHQLNHLKHVEISSCSRLVSFPAGGLPSTNLMNLQIRFCEKLEDLPNNMHLLSHLRWIEIQECSSFVSFPAGGFPSTNLTELKILDCKKLEALPNGMHQLNRLQKFEIGNCSSLVSFPEGGLPSTKLTELRIYSCEKLKALPNHLHNLNFLEELLIFNCPGIESFPVDGFPINLTSLSISITPKICKQLFQWGLHRLSSLRIFCIEGCPDVVSFPPQERGIMLPISLTILNIRFFPDLERLSHIIQSLTSLEELILHNCPKLKSFPENGLPLSLLSLSSYECPLLKQKCEEHGGKYWPMIAYIPHIIMKCTS